MARVERAAGRSGASMSSDLVMQYNDGVMPTDKTNPQNIQRKMQTGACMPMYFVQGMDISDTVIFMLNEHYRTTMNQANPVHLANTVHTDSFVI